MITHIPASVSDGVSAHWLISNPAMDRVETHVEAGNAKLEIKTFSGNVVLDNQQFTVGDSVLVHLPRGKWQYQSSSDGINYNVANVFDSVLVYDVNFLMASQEAKPEKWGSYIMVGLLPPAPVSPLAKLTTDVTELSNRLSKVEGEIGKLPK